MEKKLLNLAIHADLIVSHVFVNKCFTPTFTIVHGDTEIEQ